MPKTTRAAVDPCLLFAEGRTADAAAEALRADGVPVKRVATEADAVHALAREPLSTAIVAHPGSAPLLARLVAAAAQRHPEIPLVVLGATASVDEAVDAMRAGVADYLPAPVEPEVLLLRLRRLRARGPAAATDEEAKARRAPPIANIPGMAGRSVAMSRLCETIDKVARYKTSVLLLGESGTGKELVARALHARGPRRNKLFVPVNCATLGRELLENELFGHERGAFTGANERKKGLFELADGGTLFLDEIGEMDPSTQAKLLRVLERNEFRRVGGTDKVKVDLSLIAATHRNLGDRIAAGTFREDLYYRLKVVTIVIPPLRERREDIPVLIEHFIADFNARNSPRARGEAGPGGKTEGGQQIRGISPSLLRRFTQHDWPGNVRELKNAVESAAILASDQMLDGDPLEVDQRVPAAGADAATIPTTVTLEEAERRIILAHLARARTKMDAARSLGIGLRTLYTKLRQYDAQR